MDKASVRVGAAILKKDVLALYPLLLLAATLQSLDVLVAKLDLWPVLNFFLPAMLIVVNSIVIF
jgi:hypothetical protein